MINLGRIFYKIEADFAQVAKAHKEVGRMQKETERGYRALEKQQRMTFREISRSYNAVEQERNRSFKTMQRSMRDLEKERSRITNTTPYKNLAGSILGVGSAVRSVIGLFSIWAAMKISVGAIQSLDSYNRLQDRIALAAENYTKVSRELNDMATRTRAPLSGLVTLYTRLEQQREKTGMNDPRMLRVVETIQKLGTVSGSTAQELSAANIQLAQMFSGDRVQMQEFHSLNEQNKELVNLIERQMGLKPGEIIKKARQGTLMVADMLKAIEGIADQADKKFAGLPLRLSDGWTIFKNNLSIGLASFDSYYGFSTKIANKIKEWSLAIGTDFAPNFIATIAVIQDQWNEFEKATKTAVENMKKDIKTLYTQYDDLIGVLIILTAMVALSAGGMKAATVIAEGYALVSKGFAAVKTAIMSLNPTTAILIAVGVAVATIIQHTVGWEKALGFLINLLVHIADVAITVFDFVKIRMMLLSSSIRSFFHAMITAEDADSFKRHIEAAFDTKPVELAYKSLREKLDALDLKYMAKNSVIISPGPEIKGPGSEFDLAAYLGLNKLSMDTILGPLEELMDKVKKAVSDKRAELGLEGLAQTSNTQDATTDIEAAGMAKRLSMQERFNQAWLAGVKYVKDYQLRMEEKSSGDLFNTFDANIQKAKEQSRAMFEIAKASSYASAVVNGFEAATAAWTLGMRSGNPALASFLMGVSIAATTAQIVGISQTQYAGKAVGGAVSANQGYRINETGTEMFSQGGKDYLLTGSKGGTITPANQIGYGAMASPVMMAGGNSVNVIVNVHTKGNDVVKDTKQSVSSNGVSVLDIFLEAADSYVASGIQRGTSKVARTIAATYGLGRGAGAKVYS